MYIFLKQKHVQSIRCRRSEDLLVFAAAFLVAFVVHRRQSINRKYPPSLPWLHVVGSLPFMGKTEEWSKFFMEKSWKLGNVIGFRAGPRYV